MMDTTPIPTEEPEPVKTGMDIGDILKILPHRYPFLLIDRVIELVRMKSIVALKNVTITEPFFQGHFPEKPIMRGDGHLPAGAACDGRRKRGSSGENL